MTIKFENNVHHNVYKFFLKAKVFPKYLIFTIYKVIKKD